MKKLLNIVLLSFVFSDLTGQMILNDPVTGRTFDTDRYSSTRGTPFLFEKWMGGTATTDRGMYTTLQLKLDAYNNVLYFNREDQPFEFLEPIRSFTLKSGSDTFFYKKGLSANSLKPEQFVQVLAEGKISFYKSEIKSISEMSEINVGMVKTFISSVRYYISKDGKIELVKLNKGDILEFMDDKKERIKEFMETTKNPGKKEVDFVKIIRFYNSL